MLKWGDMVEMGQLPVHFPHWMQGYSVLRTIWASLSSSDIPLLWVFQYLGVIEFNLLQLLPA